jgi:hypothetical protein
VTTPIRYYSSTALPTNLTVSITNADTTISVGSTSGFPASTPFTLALDYGAANEELVDVTAVAGLSLTVTRAVDFTSATSHNAGAAVRHVSSARDFRDAKTHETATTNVHGFTPADGEFVGTTKTQTLSNKTLDKATGTLVRVDLYNTGAWTTSIIGDSTNPNYSRLSIKDDEVSLRTMSEFMSNGALFLYNGVSDGDNIYRLRTMTSDLTATRWAVFSGGTMSQIPSATTTFVGYDYQAPDTSISKRAWRIAAPGATAERFVVFNDGHTFIIQQTGTAIPLSVKHNVASPTSGYMQIIDSTNALLWYVNSVGKTVAARTMDVQSTGGDAVVFNVLANTTSQTQALQRWIGQTGSVVGQVSATGAASFSLVSSGGNVTANGKLQGNNLRAGTAQTPASGSANATSTVDVTFSSPMASTPRVVATSSSTSGNVDSSNIRWFVDNESTTGFTIRCARASGTTATNFNWIAIVE